MHEVDTFQTEPLQLKLHNRSKTIAFSVQQLKSENHQTPIKDHFKAFLNNQLHQASFKNPMVTKFSRINHSRSYKKSTISGQLFEESLQTKLMPQDFTCQNKIKEPAKCYKSDISKQIFKEILISKQKRKMVDTIQSRLQSIVLQATLKKGQENQSQVKSFGTFLEGMKRKISRQQNYAQKSCLLLEPTTNREQLKIQGNHKELKHKNVKSSNKSKDVDKNRPRSISQQLNQVKENDKHQDKNTKTGLKIRQSDGQPIKKQSAKSINRVQGCFKNLYSPFNGIQIRYLSSQNQNLFQRSYNSNDQKNRTLVVNSVKKPMVKVVSKKRTLTNDVQKGIIFRSKQAKLKQIPQSIQGWKVEPSNDQPLDLCIQF